MKNRYLTYFFLSTTVLLLSSCDKEDSISCNASSYSGTYNCNSGYAVSTSGCCPDGFPYYCANTASCFYQCETAEKECAGHVIKGITSTSGGGGGGGNQAGYDYTFTCPVGSGGTVPIPAASAACQKAYEYYARVYGCNDVSQANMDAANCGMCKACGYQNYCSLCP